MKEMKLLRHFGLTNACRLDIDELYLPIWVISARLWVLVATHFFLRELTERELAIERDMMCPAAYSL